MTASSTVSGCRAPGASGALAKRASITSQPNGASCDYPCPDALPLAPTTGPLAFSPPSADIDKRAIAGRIHFLEKRGPASVIAKIDTCNLATPAGSPVTRPAYPGGFDFWNDEKNGVLSQKYSSLSRYYRTKKDGCLATITAVPADQITPQQNSGDTNEQVSVDHACKQLLKRPALNAC